MNLCSRISSISLAAAVVVACLLPGNMAYSQLNTLSTVKLMKSLEEQAGKMAGKEFVWTETIATTGGTGPYTVPQFQFDAQGMLTNGTPNNVVFKYRSDQELYAAKSDARGNLEFEFFADKGGSLATASHKTKTFIEDQQRCAFRSNAVQLPTLRILAIDRNPEAFGFGKKTKWKLVKLPPEQVELVYEEGGWLYVRATFAVPSFTCVSLEIRPGSNVEETIRAIPGASVVDGLPFLPSAYRRETTSGGTKYVTTSKMKSVTPLNLQTFPPYGPPPGFESMSSREYMQKIEDRALRRIGK